MNRKKNQNRMGMADLSPRLSLSLSLSLFCNPWVLRYAGHNARFPSETILIRMRGADFGIRPKRKRERERERDKESAAPEKIYFLITELFT